MKTIFRISFLLFFLLVINNNSKAQQQNVPFYDVIDGDSVVMYFNTRYYLTAAPCAEFKRYTKVDKNGDFSGNFTDSTFKNTIVAKGNYSNGVKDGYFELYYPNGQIKCKGNYKNGIEDGEWQFYYEDGKPERTLKCTPDNILLIHFFDRQGNPTVKDGNGQFDGRVAAETDDRFIVTAVGKVVNGKPDGKWISKFGKDDYCNETFKDGNFIEGGCPGSGFPEKKHYNKISLLNTFFLSNYFSSLEAFKITECRNAPKQYINLDTTKAQSNPFTFDIAKFQSYALGDIRSTLQRSSRSNTSDDYTPGDHILTIAFSTNEKGIPEKFKQTTVWGDVFYDDLVRTITKYVRYPPTDKKIYFHFVLTVNEGNTVSERIFISPNPSAL